LPDIPDAYAWVFGGHSQDVSSNRVRVLEQLARDRQEKFPIASKVLVEGFYVDDVLTGGDTEDELINRCY